MSRRYHVGDVDVTDAVRELVDQAPPLTTEQRERLRGLLRPVAVAARTPARTSVDLRDAA
jgi:hypothetical protein